MPRAIPEERENESQNAASSQEEEQAQILVQLSEQSLEGLPSQTQQQSARMSQNKPSLEWSELTDKALKQDRLSGEENYEDWMKHARYTLQPTG
jgi:hypothetical protein